MPGYDFQRPFISQSSMSLFRAKDREDARRYGGYVKACELSNVEYKIRFTKLNPQQTMKPPPSCGRIFSGYLVIRNLDTQAQYETWMPCHVFDELYEGIAQSAPPANTKNQGGNYARSDPSHIIPRAVHPISEMTKSAFIDQKNMATDQPGDYAFVVKLCEQLSYREKLKLAQLLIQLARKEKENLTPNHISVGNEHSETLDYVMIRLSKSRPTKRASLENFISAMFQFRGGMSENERNDIINRLQSLKHISIDTNGRVSYNM